jgi:hypothetical protein
MTSLFLTMKSIFCLLIGAALLAVTGCAGPTSGSSAAISNAGASSEGYAQAPRHEWPEWGQAGETGFSGMVDYRMVLSDPGPF